MALRSGALKRSRTSLRGSLPNLVPRAFSSTIFKMADRREKTLAKAGSRGTKISKNLGDFLSRDILRSLKQNGSQS